MLPKVKDTKPNTGALSKNLTNCKAVTQMRNYRFFSRRVCFPGWYFSVPIS